MPKYDKPSLSIIILAAGSSSRLGQPKQLVKINNTSLLEQQIENALSLTPSVHCVLGFEFEKMKESVDQLPVDIVVNSQWEHGLSSSIAKGVSSIAGSTDGVMLLLVDQWQLTKNDLQLIVEAWHKKPDKIIVCTGAGKQGQMRMGPPVIFPQQYFEQLSQLKKGEGAKSIIKHNKQNAVTVTLPRAFIDLDTPEQLIAMRDFVKQS